MSKQKNYEVIRENKLGYLKVPENVLIDIELIKRYQPEDIVIITTGSQGEPMSALYRMAFSTHKQVEIVAGDRIIISASAIPGNEKAVSKVINELSQKGANVIVRDAHVSGHACREEIKLIYSLVKPKYAIPVLSTVLPPASFNQKILLGISSIFNTALILSKIP